MKEGLPTGFDPESQKEPKRSKRIGKRIFGIVALGSSIALGAQAGFSATSAEPDSIRPVQAPLVTSSPEDPRELVAQRTSYIEETFDIGIVIGDLGRTTGITDGLDIIDETLDMLPDHFYAPNEAGDTPRIRINSYKSSYCPKECAEGKADDLNLNISQGDEEISASLTHELIHRATIETGVWYGIYPILGEDFEARRPALLADVETKLSNLDGIGRALTPDEQKKKIFYESLKYGVDDLKFDGQITEYLPIEFVAEVGKNFISGRDEFMANYGEFFPPETVGELYDFAKTEIFHGVEYEEFLVPVSH